jgi:hypothetical protein
MEPPSASVWVSGEKERNSATFPSRAEYVTKIVCPGAELKH